MSYLFICTQKFYINASKLFKFNLGKIFTISSLPVFILKWMGIESLIFEKSSHFFEGVAREIIKRIRERNERHDDFLQLLIDAASEEYDKWKRVDAQSHHINEGKDEMDIEKKTLNVKITKKMLNDEEIVAQVIRWLVRLKCLIFFTNRLFLCVVFLTVCSLLRSRLSCHFHSLDFLYIRIGIKSIYSRQTNRRNKLGGR